MSRPAYALDRRRQQRDGAAARRQRFEFLSENIPARGLIQRLGGEPRLRGTEGLALLALGV